MADMTTDEMLDALAKVGRPSLFRMDSGRWHAKIELPTPEGVTLDVASDFNHPTHRSALTQLMARMGSIATMGADVSRALTITESPDHG